MTPKIRRALFRIIYVLPTLIVQVVRVARHAPTVGDPVTILGLVFGSFALSILVGAALLPALLRRFDERQLAAQWRSAALQAIDFPSFWIPLWAAVYVPLGPLGTRLVVGAAACVVTFVTLRYVDRRWLHVGLYET